MQMKGCTRVLALALACVMHQGLPAGEAPATGDAPLDELDEVLVRGELPGPAMWKVTRDDHTLWIMGTLSPMPERMSWRQKQVEDVIRASGEILAESDSELDMDLGFFQAVGMLRSALRLRHNAGGATLREVLPDEVYARWHAAHRRWFGKDPGPKERARPLYAAILLYQRALEKSGLTDEPRVWSQVERVARKNDVKIRRRVFRLEVKDPKGMLAELQDLPRERETACLVDAMDFIDRELPDMKRRATAWAHGDIAALRAIPRPPQQPDCLRVAEGTQAQQLVDRGKALSEEDWSGIVDWLLLTHPTSFTTLPIEELFEPDGVLGKLRRRGYTVEEPQ